MDQKKNVFEARAVTERHRGVSIVHMVNSQTGRVGRPHHPPTPPTALTGAGVDTVLANLTFIVSSKKL